MNLSIDEKTMPTPKAMRKTPLKNEPKSCARCHPKLRAWGELSRSDICKMLFPRPTDQA